MKKAVSLLVFMALLFSCAAADQAVELPGNRYVIFLPEGMKYSAPAEGDARVQAYISEELEMDYLAYSREEATGFGMLPTLRETAEKLKENGTEAELREAGGVEMLVYRLTDDADGAQGICYVFEDGDTVIEVIFWFATQDAAERSKTIMESIREKQDAGQE